jgi:glycosyltransferase involved in cell wall biosynthesis
MGKFAGGGSQRSISYLSETLPDNFQLRMLVTHEHLGYPFKGKVDYLKLSEFTRRGQYHIHIKRFFQKLFGAKRIVDEYKPDYVIALDPEWALLAGLISRKSVFYIQNVPSVFVGNKPHHKFLIKFICSIVSKIVCPSHGVKRDLETNFNVNKSIFIYNAVDIKEVLRLSDQPLNHVVISNWKEEGLPIFIAVGRMSQQKGLWHLVRAFAEVCKSLESRLVIVGDGVVESPYMVNLIKDLGLSEKVLLTGFLNNPFPLLKASSVFVLPSLYEGFGHVCLEAMICGLPVILSDCPGGPREIAAPTTSVDYKTKVAEYSEYGVLIPVCDGVMRLASQSLTAEERAMTDVMLDFVRNKSLREKYSHLSKERAEYFSMERFSDEWIKTFV